MIFSTLHRPSIIPMLWVSVEAVWDITSPHSVRPPLPSPRLILYNTPLRIVSTRAIGIKRGKERPVLNADDCTLTRRYTLRTRVVSLWRMYRMSRMRCISSLSRRADRVEVQVGVAVGAGVGMDLDRRAGMEKHRGQAVLGLDCRIQMGLVDLVGMTACTRKDMVVRGMTTVIPMRMYGSKRARRTQTGRVREVVEVLARRLESDGEGENLLVGIWVIMRL